MLTLCWHSTIIRDLHAEEVYLNIFEDTTDPLEQRILAQRMMDVMALRPRLDLQDGAMTYEVTQSDEFRTCVSNLEI